ncbi:hypothetical protein P5V15_011692 [Pogonomyrmex californicus]
MNNIKDREKIAKQIAKTSDSIRKKYRALKTGKIDEDVALERRFKPIVKPLKQIVKETHPTKKVANVAKDISIKKKKKREDSDDDDDTTTTITTTTTTTTTTTNRDSYWTDVGWLKLSPQSKKRTKQLNTASDSFTFDSTSIEPSKELSKIPLFMRNENIFEQKMLVNRHLKQLSNRICKRMEVVRRFMVS